MTKTARVPNPEQGIVNARAALLPHLPVEKILACYGKAKGNELGSGKFASPESSAALAANTFGFFVDRADDLPPLPGWTFEWQPEAVRLEVEARFPWRGGLHPWLDALVETDRHLIGIESKRYEPFRTRAPDGKAPFSDAYRRDVWGTRMGAYAWLRDGLSKRPPLFERLDAVQLVKHAFGLRTRARACGKAPVLAYAYAEPKAWPGGGKPIRDAEHSAHAEEVRWFARLVAGDEVGFMAFTYAEQLEAFALAPSPDVRRHGEILRSTFDC